MVASVLVVDDEPGIVRFLDRALVAACYDVITASDGVEGLRRATSQHVDLVVLDLLMPGLGGMAVLTALLEHDPTQRVVVLSAAGSVSERVACLEHGAVDFVLKPFSVAELLARIRTRLHHAATGASGGSGMQIVAGGVRLDPSRRLAYVDDRQVELSAREYLVMAHLMGRAGEPVSRQELLSDVWGLTFDPGSNVVDVCVGRLRAKISGDLIETVRNVGYSFRSA